MAGRADASLPAGRSTAPLSARQIRGVAETFLGLDETAPARHDPDGRTRFLPEVEEGVEVGVIYFAADVFPGPSVVDPNSALSMKAAVAHEISHFHRWKDHTELPSGTHDALDEAFTSLDAALRFQKHLSEHEIQQLIRDAVQRLQMHRQDLGVD